MKNALTIVAAAAAAIFAQGVYAQASAPTRAEVPAVFDIVGLGKWRDHGRASGDLADAAQNDFWPAIVGFYGSKNLNRAALELSHIPDVFEIARKDDDGERAH